MRGLVVVIKGVLRGMGHDAKCEVLARKQSSDLGSGYAEYFVLNAPADLPDGEYLVLFDGHSFHSTKRSKVWLSSSQIARDETPLTWTPQF